ncbi:MAG: hypothetical protein JO100_00205 [Pseudonocardia sp.]|nr:hypothetical protein [Pseudonocardia sp.]
MRTGWRATLPPLPEGVYWLDAQIDVGRSEYSEYAVYASTPLAVLDVPADAQEEQS